MFASTKLLSANAIDPSSSLFHNTIPLTLFKVLVSPVSKSWPSWLSVIVASYKTFESESDCPTWFISTSTASDNNPEQTDGDGDGISNEQPTEGEENTDGNGSSGGDNEGQDATENESDENSEEQDDNTGSEETTDDNSEDDGN